MIIITTETNFEAPVVLEPPHASGDGDGGGQVQGGEHDDPLERVDAVVELVAHQRLEHQQRHVQWSGEEKRFVLSVAFPVPSDVTMLQYYYLNLNVFGIHDLYFVWL